jgi:glycosyltransferase involved in cell wall biosynthesis
MIDLSRRTRFTFRLYGTRDRWGRRSAEWADRYVAPIRDAGANIELIPLLEYEEFLRSLESVAVGLQPVCPENEHSRGRSFGKILAYLTSGAAVVASNAVDHPLFFRSGENGIMVENDAALWTEACASLLQDPALRARIAAAGRIDLGLRLVASSAAEKLDAVLLRVISAQPER